MPFDTIEQALEDIRQGKLVIVADDEDRENEGDLVCAASLVTPATVNFMTQFGRGLICVALTQPRATALGLPLMTDENSDPPGDRLHNFCGRPPTVRCDHGYQRS